MHFLFPHGAAVPAGLRNSLFLPRNSVHPVPRPLRTKRILRAVPPGSGEAAAAESNELLSSQLPWYSGEEQKRLLRNDKSWRELGWKFLRNRHWKVGLGEQEGKWEAARIYCKGMTVSAALIPATLTTQQWWWQNTHTCTRKDRRTCRLSISIK